MSSPSVPSTLPPSLKQPGFHRYQSYLLVLLLAVVVMVVTKPEHYGDTPVYAADILSSETTPSQPGKNPLWEFGHVLWRPIGWVMWKAVGAIPPLASRFDDRLQIYLGLMAVSITGGLVAVLAMHALATAVLGFTPVIYILSLGMLLTNAFLNYWQTGSAYQPGLACVTLALFLVYRAANERAPSVRDAVMAGACLGLGICLWLPYVFAAPAIAFVALFWGPRGVTWDSADVTKRLRFLSSLAGTCLLVGVLSYGVAIRQNRINSPAMLKAWSSEASHEIAQSRQILRLPMGLPRSFIHMGEDGMLFKRYLLKDPYAPVGFADLLRVSLIKISLFYLSLLALLILLWRAPAGRGMLFLLIVGCLPVIVFAVTLFEPGQPDRYLPMYPFVFLALAQALTVSKNARPLRLALMGMVVVGAAVNLNAMWVWDPETQYREVFARQRTMAAQLRPNSVVVTVNYRDDLSYAQARYPFHAAFRPPLPLFEATEAGTLRARVWPALVARRTLLAWSSGGEVWVSKRVLADKPLPAWRWVEGDDPYLHWVDLPRFFQKLESTREIGGDDGFFLVAPSEANRRVLDETVRLVDPR